MTRERSRHRDTSSGKGREQDRKLGRETGRGRETRRSRPPRSRLRDGGKETPDSTPRTRRRSQPQSQATQRDLSSDALAALNRQTQRQSLRLSRDASDDTAATADREARIAAREQRHERTMSYSARHRDSQEYGDPRESTDHYRCSRDHHRDSRDYNNNSYYYDYYQHAPGRRGNGNSQDYYVSGAREYQDATGDQRCAAMKARVAENYESGAERFRAATHNDERRRGRWREKKKRVVSGAVMEEGIATRGGASRPESEEHSMLNEKMHAHAPKRGKRRLSKKRTIIFGGVVAVLIIVLIVVAVVVSRNNRTRSEEESDINNIDENSIPEAARGTYLDPFTWHDTTDFNLTYTNHTFGDLPVMGLFDVWDDSTRANNRVPALDEDWGSYGDTPARGVNLGGWLNVEPFITPSLFDYDISVGIIDEWTLSAHLGDKANQVLEKHYATFVTEQSLAEIADAGLDHVRIPYGYWAVATYDDDPYVFRTSWRYLLRGIEWARKHGLRVKLDIHGLPGSQNGWNHSGRQGEIGWLNGTDGDLNARRSLEIHDRLSRFFSQDRYKNIIAFYGLGNEPKMTALDMNDVIDWTAQAYNVVRDNGISAIQAFGDGFMGLEKWQGRLSGYGDTLVLDVHQYVIFNVNQIVFTHQEKIQYACQGWTWQAEQSMNPSTGFGPTIFAEWTQADTDCAPNLNNVGVGSRWEGTYDPGTIGGVPVLSPRCPTRDVTCSCSEANADPARWSQQYKRFLKMFAEAQMHAFERGWGWWYWTWDTESAPQWSYKKGLDAGILPEKAWEREFNCDGGVPVFEELPESY